MKHVLKTFGKPIEIIDFDWVTSLRTAGLHRSVEALWNKTKDTVKDFAYSCGSDVRGKAIIKYLISFCIRICSHIIRRQTGIIRVACADSLDRTHMVIFVLTLPIIAELAKSVALLPSSSGSLSISFHYTFY